MTCRTRNKQPKGCIFQEAVIADERLFLPPHTPPNWFPPSTVSRLEYFTLVSKIPYKIFVILNIGKAANGALLTKPQTTINNEQNNNHTPLYYRFVTIR